MFVTSVTWHKSLCFLYPPIILQSRMLTLHQASKKRQEWKRRKGTHRYKWACSDHLSLIERWRQTFHQVQRKLHFLLYVWEMIVKGQHLLFFFAAIDYIHFLHKEKKKQEEEVSVLRKEVMALKIMKTWDGGSQTFSANIPPPYNFLYSPNMWQTKTSLLVLHPGR